MSKKTGRAKARAYKLSVGTADEYEDYIAEIYFPGKAGAIISQEKNPGEFEISLHSLNDSAAQNFDSCRNVPETRIRLSEFNEAIDVATNELKRLKKT